MHPFEQKLLDSWPYRQWGDLTILLAISGGGDSAALLRAICAIRDLATPQTPGQVVAAHFNHHLRGEAADRDEQFVTGLCKMLGVECLVGHADPGRHENNQGEGVESLARRARYAFLEKAAAGVGARYLVTAHTFDDQVETILHRILRGTGLKGLGGIARARRINDSLTLLRPMLDLRREEIVAYLADLEQPFCEDATNTDQVFTRNRLRHDLLPTLRDAYNPAVDEAIVRLGQLARENQMFLDETLDDLIETCVQKRSSEAVTLDRSALKTAPSYLIRELMTRLWTEQGWPQQAMGYEQWHRLATLLQTDPASDDTFNPQVALPGGITVEIHDQTIRVRRSSI
ncbi:MAG: tRNA lysidine(34) synthetase TilS [Planctomycetia bacterium]|jgi:tRNA(Ile)-lysidine synthase